MDYTTENINCTNMAHVCGTVLDNLEFSHKTYGETFYIMKIGVYRHSGYEDQINVMISERLINEKEIYSGMQMEIWGQIRTYNQEEQGHNKLNIVLFAREIHEVEEEAYINEINLEGFICKEPMERITPLGRKLCDIMLAVNRMYNKSDYIPCITWGRNASYSASMSVGDCINVQGRLQSRQYKKKMEDGQVVEKTAYEVSVIQLEKITENVI